MKWLRGMRTMIRLQFWLYRLMLGCSHREAGCEKGNLRFGWTRVWGGMLLRQSGFDCRGDGENGVDAGHVEQVCDAG